MAAFPPADQTPRPAGDPTQPLDHVAELNGKGTLIDTSVPPPPAAAQGPRRPPRELSDDDLRSPRAHHLRRPLVLFVLTCASTFWAGATLWMPHLYLNNAGSAWLAVQTHWREGLTYMAAVMGILLMHEMGHFVQTVRYRVPATLPLFLPLPIMMTGTMGAVIAMDGSKADRKQLFDIGLSGPWAGLVVAIPMIWFGIKSAVPDPSAGDFPFGTPLIFKLITAYVRPELAGGAVLKNSLFMAGWVGMLVTGLNMLPVSQLDGGHVIYGLFGQRAKWIARAFILSAIGFVVITEQYNWVVMIVLVLMLGVDHPPTRDDSVRLGPVRWTIGLVSLLIPVFCFTPLIIPAGM